MKKLLLNDNWQFLSCGPQDTDITELVKPQATTPEWLDISMPGDINASLVQHGKMPDPHYDTQARECYWVAGQDWWYRLVLNSNDIDAAHAELCFTGVDGHADLWINETFLGTMKNAFREHRFSLASHLSEGENILWLRFHAVESMMHTPRFDELAGWAGRRAIVRKPGFTFGWDWALPLPSIGLSGEVWIENAAHLRLTDFAIQPFCSGRVDFSFEVTPEAKRAGCEIRVAVTGHGADIEHTVVRNTHKSYCSLHISDPQSWWPNGYGAANLYQYSVQLVVAGEVVDERSGKLGLRESRIVEKPFTPDAGPGFSFNIEINGESIFCKGGNMIPLDLAPGLATVEGYEWYLRKAKEAGFNMLRIWGGGVYEKEVFYQLCDELGLMVWQDFMFASTGYPVDLLRDEIIAEADYQLRRLRNHSCIVLWCGCNEDVYSWSYKVGGAPAEQDDTGPHAEADPAFKVDRLKNDPQLYSMILRGSVGLKGLGVPYVESSPQSRDDAGNMPNSGNCHISCWKTALFHPEKKPEKWREHFEAVCSFDSEFCIQGPCSMEAIQTFMAPENHWPPNEAWIYHIQRGHQNIPHYEQTLYIAGAIFGEIDSLQKYVKYGQATHLEMMRAEFESARRDRPNNGGTMMWMYNDCWPTANWSIIDYYRQPKPSYYAAKRACEPLLPIIFERGGVIGFFLGNDSLDEPGEVQLRYGCETLDGKVLWSREKSITAPRNGTIRFDEIVHEELSGQAGEFLFIDASTREGQLPRVIYFPDGWKHVTWPEPNLSVELLGQTQVEGRYISRLRLKTDSFARLCHVLHPTQRDFWPSDNYFDLAAGGEREIEVSSAQAFAAEELILGHWNTQWR